MDGVSSIASAAQLLKMFGNARGSSGAIGFPTESDPANTAATNATTPPSLPSGAQLSMETLLALQSDEPKPTQTSATSAPTAEDLFLQEAHKSPMQRLREQILDSLGLTEDQLAQMPADERRAVEDRIADIIKQKIRQANGGDQSTQQTDLPSALQQFA